MKHIGTPRAATAALISLLETENRALAVMDVATVSAALDRKRELVEAVASALAERREASPPDVAAAQHLARLIRENGRRLEAALRGQRELMKVLAGALRGAGERTVYARHGEAMNLAHVTGLTIATSA